MAANAKANPGYKGSEQKIDNRNQDNETGSNTDNNPDTELDTSVHADHETPRTVVSSTPIDPAKVTNTTGGD